MSEFDSIKSQLLKIKALADRGVAGEKAAAAAKLDALLKKHGLSIEDLSSVETQDYSFSFKSEMELDVLIQCIAMIKGMSGSIHFRKNRKSKTAIFELTRLEYEDVNSAFQHYRLIFRREFEKQFGAIQKRRFFSAFVNKYGIAGPGSGESKEEPMSEEEMWQLIAMMKSIKGEAWSKPKAQITNG